MWSIRFLPTWSLELAASEPSNELGVFDRTGRPERKLFPLDHGPCRCSSMVLFVSLELDSLDLFQLVPINKKSDKRRLRSDFERVPYSPPLARFDGLQGVVFRLDRANRYTTGVAFTALARCSDSTVNRPAHRLPGSVYMNRGSACTSDDPRLTPPNVVFDVGEDFSLGACCNSGPCRSAPPMLTFNPCVRLSISLSR